MAEETEFVNNEMQQMKLWRFYHSCIITATIQGKIAYLLMSIHAVNPCIFKTISTYDPHRILFANMVYGIGVMLYWRPTIVTISKFNRFVFSLLGSLMFNHSSMIFYGWLVENMSDKPYFLTFLGFLSGRLMMLHLMAFLYHIDSNRAFRYIGRTSPDFESMYRRRS